MDFLIYILIRVFILFKSLTRSLAVPSASAVVLAIIKCFGLSGTMLSQSSSSAISFCSPLQLSRWSTVTSNRTERTSDEQRYFNDGF